MKPCAEIDILYARISREDADKTDMSNSIKNQQIILEQHAEKLGLKNTRFYNDDGLSGVFFDTREDFTKVLELIQKGLVRTLIVKDLSRLGRNYHETGELVETILPYYNVRFISIGDGIDNQNKLNKRKGTGGLDIVTAFKNLMNEAYVQDISQKRRMANVAKSSQGYAIGKAPYGYMNGNGETSDKKRWIIDTEASRVVRKIFELRLSGLSAVFIAEKLSKERIEIPAVYAFNKGYTKRIPISDNFFEWSHNTVVKILKNRSYTGDVINFKTYTNSYKDKKRHSNSEDDWDIHVGVHEAIISQEDFEIVQQSFKRNVRNASDLPKHILSGILYCSDCGSKMNFKQDKNKPSNNSFVCGNNRRAKTKCPSTHTIRVRHIAEAVTKEISNLVNYSNDFEQVFLQLLFDKKAEQNYQELQELQELYKIKSTRNRELDLLFKQMYEDKIRGLISEEQFISLSGNFAVEQSELRKKITVLEKQIKTHSSKKINTGHLVDRLRRFTSLKELTAEIVDLFIEKIVVYDGHVDNTVIKQRIDIHYKFLGHIEVPKIETKEKNMLKKSFSRTNEAVCINNATA